MSALATYPDAGRPIGMTRSKTFAGVADACVDQWGRHALAEMETAQ